MKDTKNAFDKETNYKLYRTVKELIHPSISKKNISDYKIVIDDNLLSLRVFYPQKISNLQNIIIFVPGDGNLTGCNYQYSSICKDLALELESLIIAIDYYETINEYPTILEKIETTIKYLYTELEKFNINKNQIILMGDSSGANYVSAITFRLIKNKFNYVEKEILLYPLLSGNYFDQCDFASFVKAQEYNKELVDKIKNYIINYSKDKKNLNQSEVCPLQNKDFSYYPKTLVITGDLDPLRDEGEAFYKKLDNNSKYENVIYASHGFLNDKNLDVRKKYLNSIKEFI